MEEGTGPMTDLGDLSVEALYERWERELAQLRRDPDPQIIAALEEEALDRGVDLFDIYDAIRSAERPVTESTTPAETSRGGVISQEPPSLPTATVDSSTHLVVAGGTMTGELSITAAIWDPDLHPRGRDGKFIEKFGLVKLFNHVVKSRDGRRYDLTGRRGQVSDIVPNSKSPGKPDVKVRLLGPDGKADGPEITVKPENVEMAPEKARLNMSQLADQRAARAGRPLEAPAPNGRDEVSNSSSPGIEEPAAPAPATPTPALRRVGDVATDEELRRYAQDQNVPTNTRVYFSTDKTGGITGGEEWYDSDEKLPDEVFKAADNWAWVDIDAQGNVTTGRTNSKPRKTVQQLRDELTASVNEQAENLSTDDPVERAAGLDKILSKLRFSIIDTDKVHDHLYPPENGGRWTKERDAIHNEMVDEIIAAAEDAGVPKDRDAFVLGGLPGAGKSYTLRPGQKGSNFGVVAWEPGQPIPEGVTHVSVNPDIVKEMLIQRGMLPEGIEGLKPMEQVTFIHEESSYLAKKISQRLGNEGYNVVLDNTMDSSSSMLKRMTPLARDGYKFRALFVDIPVEESKASARKRYMDAALTPLGGRFVPSSVQANSSSSKGSMSKNRDAFDQLVAQDWFGDYMVIDNTGVLQRKPKGEITVQGTGGGTAVDDFNANFGTPSLPLEPEVPAAPEAPAGEAPPAAPAPAAPVV